MSKLFESMTDDERLDSIREQIKEATDAGGCFPRVMIPPTELRWLFSYAVSKSKVAFGAKVKSVVRQAVADQFDIPATQLEARALCARLALHGYLLTPVNLTEAMRAHYRQFLRVKGKE